MAAERVERLDAADIGPGVVALLLSAAGPGAKPAAVSEPYLHGATLLAVRRDADVVGVLGLEVAAGSTATVRALAVDPVHREQGLGRALVHSALEQSRRPLVAETDADAVGFYRACGFDVVDLGERHPGVRRFRCVLTPAASYSARAWPPSRGSAAACGTPSADTRASITEPPAP